MSRLEAFGRFWWSFIVGDDWLSAAGVVLALAVTAVLAHEGLAAWPLLPLAVLVVLYVSLRRATPNR
jgi:hypothetical protein